MPSTLDPAYINAWRRLYEVGEQAHLDHREQNAAILKVLSLDPHRRHGRIELDSVTDLAGLWRIGKEISKKTLSDAPTVSLPASGRAIEAARKAGAAVDNWNLALRQTLAEEGRPKFPGQLLAETRLVRAAIAVLDGG